MLGTLRLATIIAATIALFPGAACAQSATDYPARPVRVIVPSAPGGFIDIFPRLVVAKLTESMKRQFVVENITGGGGTIGIGLVAKAAPDGYTLLAAGPVFTVAPALYPNVAYDSIKGFVPISLMAKSPSLLLVHPALPVTSMKQLIALARSKPGALDMGVGFSGSFTHLAAAYFASAAHVNLTFIPYRGSGEAMVGVMGGNIQMLFANVGSTIHHIKAGKLRALAVTSAERTSALPDLPSIAESAAPGYDVTSWHGWLAPAGTPAAVVNRLNTEIAKAIKSPDLAQKLTQDGGQPLGGPPEQFQQLIAAEVPPWAKVVKETRMRVE